MMRPIRTSKEKTMKNALSIVIVILVILAFCSVGAQEFNITYGCSELPGPWNITGNGNILGPAEYHHLLDNPRYARLFLHLNKTTPDH